MANDIWTAMHVESLAPDAASIPAARKVLSKGGFGRVEPTADGRGWWVVCQGLTDTYQTSARLQPGGSEFDCTCNCLSYKNPCKHALALLFHLVDHPELRVEKEEAKVEASDFEALLKAVFANPDEDTPRLVFADFVEENGDSDRAALIRLQCEQARLKPQAKRYRELTAELKPLLAKVKRRIEPLPDSFEYELRRGFVRLDGELDDLDSGALPARVAALFREGWVEAVKTVFLSFDGLGEIGIQLVAQIGELDASDYYADRETLTSMVADTAEARATGRLSRVIVHRSNQKEYEALAAVADGADAPVGRLGAERRHGYLNPRTFDLLLRTGQLSGARAMTLGGLDLGDAQLQALLDRADLSKLRELWLSEWDLSRAGIRSLANSQKLGQLTEMNFDSITLGAEAENAVPALAANTGLRNVERLRFVACACEDADARTLAKSKGFPKLKLLELTRNDGVTAAGAAALLASKNLPLLAHCELQDTQIAEREQLPLLLAAADRPELRLRFAQLDLKRRIGVREVTVEISTDGSGYDGAFDDLATAKGAERVTQLLAPRCHVGATEMPDLAAGFDAETLWKLDLTDNPLRNDGVAALATAFAGFHLRELVLSECRIQGAGVAALTASDLYARLHTLDLSQNNLGKAGVAALLKADVPPKLKRLVLTDGRLTADDTKKLKIKFGSLVKL